MKLFLHLVGAFLLHLLADPVHSRSIIDCYGARVQIQLRATHEDTSPTNDRSSPPLPTSLYTYPALLGSPLNSTATSPFFLYNETPDFSCLPGIQPPRKTPAAALVKRGGCTFETKAFNLQQAGYSAMLVFDLEGQDGSCLIMSSNNTDVSIVASGITPAAGMLLHDFLLEEEEDKEEEMDSSPFSSSSSHHHHHHQLEITLSIPPISGHDPSLLALWIMAVGSLILASLWSSSIELHKIQRGGRKREHGSGGGSSDDEDQVAVIDVKGAASFIVFASAGLLIMFFLLSKWLMMVLVVLFALATMQAMAWVMIAALHHFARHHYHGSSSTTTSTSQSSIYTMTINLPSFLGGGKTKLLDLLCICLAAGTSTTWIVIRNQPSAWILQDIMSIALIINVLLILKIPNLKVATILLPLAFLYDIWWVFLQPAVTGGPSVMVAVATGGGVGESLPMLLKFPQLNALGTNRPMSLLGLGDVVLPGLLVAFICKYDALKMMMSRGANNNTFITKYRYFIPAIIGYGCGLLLTYAALTFSWFGDQGQPALLYLVPCTLGPVLFLGWMRGELKGLWEFDEEEKRILLLNNNNRSRGGDEDDGQQGGYASHGSSDGPDTALLSSPNSVV